MSHDAYPFTAATNKLAYAQAFAREPRATAAQTRGPRALLATLLHRSR